MKNIDMFKVVKNNILKNYNTDDKYLIVLSAVKNLTNRLYDISNEFKLDYLKDELIKEGENISCLALYNELKNNLKTKIIYPQEINLLVEKNKIVDVNLNILLEEFKKNNVLIIPGFYGKNNNNEIELLMRNGSDTTALYIYNKLNNLKIETSCELYKDEVLYQIDPKIENSQHLKNISFDELDLIKDYNKKFISNEGMNIIIENKLPVDVINFFSNETTCISIIESPLNLIGKYYEKGYELEISNINNYKIFNYLNKIKCDILDVGNNKVTLFINKKILKHLHLLKLIDSSIICKISKKYKIIYVYKTNINYLYTNNITEEVYENTY